MLFCSSPLRNDNIPIHDMHKNKAPCTIYNGSFHKALSVILCSATKRFNCNIPLHSKALRSLRVIMQCSPGSTQDRKLSQHDSNVDLDVTHQNKQLN